MRVIFRIPLCQLIAFGRGISAGLVHILADSLFTGQFGKEALTTKSAFHMQDRGMHPQKRHRGDGEQQHEAACPDADNVIHDPEGNRQEEPAKTANQPDNAAHRADMVRVIDRDVFVDRRLAKRHEEAEQHRQRHKDRQLDNQPEGNRPLDAVNDIACRRIGQKETDHHRGDESPVHHSPRAITVGHPAAKRPEHRSRQRIGRRQHAGRGDAETVDADIIARQPQRQRNEGAENKEVIEREPPYLQPPQRLQMLDKGFGLLPMTPAFGKLRVVTCQQKIQHRRDGENDGIDLRRRLPAKRHQQERRAEIGNRRADIADTEDPERRSLTAAFIPARHIGDADRETATGKPDPKCRQQHHRIGADR